jgi:hypothetical protein
MSTEQELYDRLDAGELDIPPVEYIDVELGENGAGQTTYRVVTVSAAAVVPAP